LDVAEAVKPMGSESPADVGEAVRAADTVGVGVGATVTPPTSVAVRPSATVTRTETMCCPPAVNVCVGVGDVLSATPSSLKSQLYATTGESGRLETETANVAASPAVGCRGVTLKAAETPLLGTGGGGGGGGTGGVGVGDGAGDGAGVGPELSGGATTGSSTRMAAVWMTSPAVAVTLARRVPVHVTRA
jgi:hypothetical protein